MKPQHDGCVVKVPGGWLWRGGGYSGIAKTRREALYLQETHATGIHQPATAEPPPPRTAVVEAGIAGLRAALNRNGVNRDATGE